MDVDQRQQAGFDGVFQLSALDAFGRGEALFMRIDGGVTAVFQRSVYTPSKGGLIPEIPPGTMFWIGRPPQSLPPRDTASQDLYLDLSAAQEPPPLLSHEPTVRTTSLITDEAYRVQRVQALLDSCIR